MDRSKMTANEAAHRFTAAIGLGRVVFAADEMRQFRVCAWDHHGLVCWNDLIWLPKSMGVEEAVRLYSETNFVFFLELRPVEGDGPVVRMDLSASGQGRAWARQVAKSLSPA